MGVRWLFALCLVALNWGLAPVARSQQSQNPAFTVVPLGVQGGLAEGNLSAYLVAPAGSNDFVCLDAGSLHTGIQKAIANRIFTVSGEVVLKQYIKAHCISHPHLDHVAGLLLNAPEDIAKPIYGLQECVATIQSEYFNWRAWPNFGNAGTPPALNKYQLRVLTPQAEIPIPNTQMSVRAFVLSHSKPYQSAAFLVRSQGSYLLYLGDTGADSVEKTDALRVLWQAVQPLVQRRQLKAIFIEASYDNSQPTQQLFGHLTPALLMQEMAALAKLTGGAALRGLPVVITHTKPSARNAAAIKKQLTEANTLQLKLVFPVQGQLLRF